MYLAAERDLARVWAGQWTNPAGRVGYRWLYRVSVTEDLLEVDDDLQSLPGVSFQVPEARVEKVYEKAVSPNQPAFARILKRTLSDLEAAKRRRNCGLLG